MSKMDKISKLYTFKAISSFQKISYSGLEQKMLLNTISS